MIRAGAPMALLLASMLNGSPAAAQSIFTASFGENADANTGVVTGRTLGVGYVRALGPGGLAAGLGLPVDPATETGWASLAGWYDATLGDTPWAARVVGAGFGYHDPLLDDTNGGLTATFHGYREIQLGGVRVTPRAGGRYGFLGGVDLSRAIAGAGVEAGAGRGPVALTASADYWLAEEGSYPELRGQVALTTAAFQARVHVTRWLDDAVPETGWGVRLQVPLTDRLSATARYTRDAPDILFFSPPRRAWSLGVQLSLGGPAVQAPTVVVAGSPVTLRAPVDDPRDEVRVAGTFNGWEPQPMTRRGDQWVLTLRLEPGVYEFAFVDARGSWFVPEDTPGRKPDGFGGFIGTLVVR